MIKNTEIYLINIAHTHHQEEGPQGFYTEKKTRGPVVLTDSVMEQAQRLLNKGLEPSEVADQLSIKRDTFSKAIRAGRLHKNDKKKRGSR